MINSVTFENFRGLRHLELPELSQITLLTGKNSAGKSSVLEGIFLLMGHSSPDTFEKIRSIRGLPAATDITKLWEPVFYNLDTSKSLTITAKCNNRSLLLDYARDESFSSFDSTQEVLNTFISFTNPVNPVYALRYSFSDGNTQESGHLFLNAAGNLAMGADPRSKKNPTNALPNTLIVRSAAAYGIDDATIAGWFGDLELNDGKQQVIEALKIIEPEITDIKTIVQQRYVQLYIKTKHSTLPLKLSGDGICKLAYLVLAILHSPNSIILIDEIENGFHYSMQKAFWETISVAAKTSNSQIIATTHSYECISHAVEGITQAGMQDDFCLYRLDRSGEASKAVHYSGELLKFAVESFMEVR